MADLSKQLSRCTLLLPLLVSCIATGSYEPPAPLPSNEDWTKTIPAPKDQVWDALIDHVSGTFFAIDNFEKGSGLITLSFGSADLARFVDGGHWTYKQPSATPSSFDGNYARFLELYRHGTLTGRMNITVREATAGTVVKVRARYIVTADPGDTWSFDTGGSATVAVTFPVRGTQPTRTLRPTHAAERSILDAVEGMLEE